MSSRKVRVKKLGVKTLLPVLREGQIDPAEYESLTTVIQIATGVEQAEENEYHLQSILKEAGTSNHQEIPVPPPEECDLNYDDLYPSVCVQPSSYVRFSQTVEECISCQYDMTTGDDEFLQSYNAGAPSGALLSEDDFERIMEVFEDTAAEQTPFASVDNTIVAYETMVPAVNHLGSPSILQHVKAIYEYWRTQRQNTTNKPLRPVVKFETYQETDDTDPYVCFRRREARQTRKTRARENKIAELLKRLRRELEDGRQLVLMTFERELMKRDVMQTDRALYDERAHLKQIKFKLGIKGDEDDLVNQKVTAPSETHIGIRWFALTQPCKPKKRKLPEAPGAQRASGAQLRAPVRSDGRSVEQELVLLSDLLAQKERELREEIESKVQNHRKWNQNHIDLTRDPLSPIKDQGMELKFRPAKTQYQYLMTPPASMSSDSMDVDDGAAELMDADKQEYTVFQLQAGSVRSDATPSRQPSFRRRIGRLHRLWIDRRGMVTPPRETNEYWDRWKYDWDDDEVEPPVYELDPYDTHALRFRGTIPLGPYMYRAGRPPLPPDGVHLGSGAGRTLLPAQAAAAGAQAQQAHIQAQAQIQAQARHIPAQAMNQSRPHLQAQVQTQIGSLNGSPRST